MHIPILSDGPRKVGEHKAVPSWPARGALEWRFGVEILINIVVPSFGVCSESSFFEELQPPQKKAPGRDQ
jgi:hypothetical protein